MFKWRNPHPQPWVIYELFVLFGVDSAVYAHENVIDMQYLVEDTGV